MLLEKIKNKTVREYYINYFNNNLNDLKFININKNISGYNFKSNRVSREILTSERVKAQNHESGIREKIILISLIENPFLVIKYTEELGKISFKDLNLSALISEILEFSASNSDKDLENLDLKSYLLCKGFEQEIKYIYQPKLLNTYNSIINNTMEVVDKSFIGLINLQQDLLEETEINNALNILEEQRDEKSFEEFARIKKESLNKS